MSKYWIVIAAKNHVLKGIHGGFVQACHGKSYPLRRMGTGDGVIFYSPKLEQGGEISCQCFTAIGCVVGEKVYRQDLGNSFSPYRRAMSYLNARDTQVKPLIEVLSFIKDKTHWGNIFKYNIIQIPKEDFKLIAGKMNVKMRWDAA